MTTATILPQARTTFLDANNNPLSGGSVYMYVPNTTTFKTTWQDAGETTPNANPIVLDGNGSCLLYGSGQYLQEVYDQNNNLVWTGLTQDLLSIVGSASIIASGASTPRTLSSYFSDTANVLNFGADPTGVFDSTTAIQNAINSLHITGGTVFFPSGNYIISSTLQIGNGSASAYSTYPGVNLVGVGSGVFPGPNNLSAVTISSNVAGPAILIQGPIGTWGVENICINITTTSTSAKGLNVISGQFGRTRNLMITGCYGTSIQTTSVGTAYECQHNSFENTNIYLPVSASSAIGILNTGAGATGGSTGSSFNEWNNTCIIINNAGQIGKIYQYCDNINSFSTEIVNAANGTAIQYNYSSTGTNGTSFPSDCRDFCIEVYSNSIVNYAPSGIGSIATENRIFGFSLTNGGIVPNILNLSVLNEAGTSKAVFYLNGAQSVGSSPAKVTLDTKVIDNSSIISTSNNRITPNRPGYYNISAQITASSFSGASLLYTIIEQNGSTQLSQARNSNNGVITTASTSVIGYFNGSTDYVELYGEVTGGSTAIVTGQQNTFMSVIGPF